MNSSAKVTRLMEVWPHRAWLSITQRLHSCLLELATLGCMADHVGGIWAMEEMLEAAIEKGFAPISQLWSQMQQDTSPRKRGHSRRWLAQGYTRLVTLSEVKLDLMKKLKISPIATAICPTPQKSN